MIRRLKGTRILVTREKSQAKQFSELLSKHGAIPLEAPLLKIDCISIKEQLSHVDVNKFEWIFFTSAHGVECFMNQVEDLSLLKNCKLATVGHKTELALKKYELHAHFIPTMYNAEVMSKEFLQQYPDAKNVLLVRGNISRKELVKAFTKNAVSFDTITVYETNFNEAMKETLIKTLNSHQLDFLTFTSPSTVQAFYEFVKDEPNSEQFLQIPTICIGTTTEKCAEQFGFQYTFIPKSFTIESMVDKMEQVVHMEGLN